MYSGKRVLVAGGTGMIGRPLVEELLRLGARVRVSSLDDPSRANPETEYLRRDLRDFRACLEVCEGQDYVFNLTGVKGSPAVTRTRPASFFVPTLTLDTNLMEAARQRGAARYQFTSSIGVYTPAPLLREDDVWSGFPSQNDRFAGWAKRMGELQAEAYRTEFGWGELTVTRPGNTYGPWDNFDLENAMVVPSLIRRALTEDPLVVWGDGTSERDFVHARDVAHGMLVVMEKNPAQPVNLGTGVPVSVRELVDAILDCLEERPRVIYDASKAAGDPRRILDVTRARSLGYAPKVSLREGVAETLRWYREHRGAFEGKRYDVFAPGAATKLLPG